MAYLVIKSPEHGDREACIKIDGTCGEDLFILTADWTDTSTPVDENVIDLWQKKYACQIYEAWLDEYASETFDRIKDLGKYG